MDRAHRRPRHRALAVALATLLVPLLVGSASAASSRPQVTVVINNGSTFAVETLVNRASNQILSCSYVLDSQAPVSCGPKTLFLGTKTTRYVSAPFAIPAPGVHTVVVTVRLTDGGGSSGSASFTVAPPKVFAIAYSNIDGLPGFDASGDELIARLVDTNRNNTLDAGDTVEMGTFPSDATGIPQIGLTVHSHVVADGFIGATIASVTYAAGGEALWGAAAQVFVEQNAGNIDDTTIYSCFIKVDEEGPSGPTATVPSLSFTRPCPALLTVSVTP